MRIGVPKEIHPGERRVAVTPETVGRLLNLGFEVAIESGAGAAASFTDEAYEKAGVAILPDAISIWSSSNIVLKVQPPEQRGDGMHEAELLREQGTLISFFWPAKNKDLIERLAARKATVLAMDQIPRITRAQKFDALSSMANIAGYRAVIEAASFFGRFFTGQMTAAGKIPPAKVLVIGAGVAGLAAVGAARGLGAIVRAFDTRAEAREQVQSMGAEFLEVSLKEEGAGAGGYGKVMSAAFIAEEMALFLRQAKEVDIIITTALIPGKPAPVLITEEMVNAMRPGSVIVDLAAENGGNCAATQPGQVVVHNGVTIIGYVDLPSRLAPTASHMYGTNLAHLLSDLGGAENWHLDLEDQVVRSALVLKQGELLWPPPKIDPPSPAAKPTPTTAAAGAATSVPVTKQGKPIGGMIALVIAALLVAAVGAVAPREFLSHFTVFVLACFVGWQVIWNVTPALHTPLMSVTNAISGIIIVGGLLQLTTDLASPVTLIGAAAVLLATINIAGGFLVTQRMLRMFHR
jgi:NAD(P) transhydrogenase subunit alpha